MEQGINVHQVFADYFNIEIRAVAYAVSKKLSEGSICLDLEAYNAEIENGSETNIYTDKKIPEDCLLNSKVVTTDETVIKPFIYKHGKVYMQRYHFYEMNIEKKIKALNAAPNDWANQLADHSEFVLKLFSCNDDLTGIPAIERVNWQAVAALSSILNNFSIITGGPGTGKTTTVAKILAILFTINPELRVALAAPTGKAAARMNESLSNAKHEIPGLTDEIKEKYDSISASTIHRLLKNKIGTPYFRHDSENPLDFDVIIIDESSMIDGALMAKLLAAIESSKKIIFLGDKDQLASVEAGSIFGDLCETQLEQINFVTREQADFINGFIEQEERYIPDSMVLEGDFPNLLAGSIVELKRSYRFKSTEGIGLFSKEVIASSLTDISPYKEIEDRSKEFVEIDTEYDATKFESYIDLYRQYILEEDTMEALKKLNNIRVLCAVRQGVYGVYEYNKKIEKYLHKKGLIQPNDSFYENQPIMVTSNDYSLQLFNGDIGIIRSNDEGVLYAWFEGDDGALRMVLPGYISSCETVFAMTIHKSQGSEFKQVVVVLPKKKEVAILTRELLYTGVTRTQKAALIQSSEESLLQAVERKVSRASGITERF